MLNIYVGDFFCLYISEGIEDVFNFGFDLMLVLLFIKCKIISCKINYWKR